MQRFSYAGIRAGMDYTKIDSYVQLKVILSAPCPAYAGPKETIGSYSSIRIKASHEWLSSRPEAPSFSADRIELASSLECFSNHSDAIFRRTELNMMPSIGQIRGPDRMS